MLTFMFLVAIISIVMFLWVVFSIVKLLIYFIWKRNRELMDLIDTKFNILFTFPALIAIILTVFMVQKLIKFYISFLHQIFSKVIETVIGAGLLCGFLSIATISWVFYLILVPRLYFDNFEDSFYFEHHQKKVGAIVSFVTGQLLRFTYAYNRALYERLVTPLHIVFLFVGFFVFQLLWTHQTIIRNWRFLYPNDKRKRIVRRVLLLQVEFMINFFVQFGPSDSLIEKPDSMVCRLIDRYLEDRGQTILFVQSSLVGWSIGLIFFMIFYTKVFGLIAPSAQSYWNSFQKGSNRASYDDSDDFYFDDEDDRGFNPFKPPKPKK